MHDCLAAVNEALVSSGVTLSVSPDGTPRVLVVDLVEGSGAALKKNVLGPYCPFCGWDISTGEPQRRKRQ